MDVAEISNIVPLDQVVLHNNDDELIHPPPPDSDIASADRTVRCGMGIEDCNWIGMVASIVLLIMLFSAKNIRNITDKKNSNA